MDIKTLDDTSKLRLVNGRWSSSSEIWNTISRTYSLNTAVYENRADWLSRIPYVRQQYRVQANRVFVDMEAVINTLIANPPGINVLPARSGTAAQDFARQLESYFRKKYIDLNTKEVLRMALRNLYFGRLAVIKAFWNPVIDDFDFRALDPRKVRFGKYAKNEDASEFAIEEIEDNLCAVIDRFPGKKKELMQKFGIFTEEELYIKNPDVTYKESWIQDHVLFTHDNIVLDTIKNPYWDWDGLLITKDEEAQLMGDGSEQNPGLEGQERRTFMQQIKLDQDNREQQLAASMQPPVEGAPVAMNPDGTPAQPAEPVSFEKYYYNYFQHPRKPYIFATIFNNENSPIGRTDMITLSAELQRGIDKRKMDIDENCELVNGIVKVDASVMGKSDAQRIRFETRGIIWGKGVGTGVTRETGPALPAMVFEDMQDSRAEIDSIMAASSAFKGEREGQETKGGRLALIQQSFQRLNEMVQVVDYLSGEMFAWGMQLSKTRYTEYHKAKIPEKDGSTKNIDLIQDDIETGTEVRIIAGKTLPVDDESKFEQAQNDVKEGYLSPVDYLEIAKYDNAKELAKNAVMYKVNPVVASGITPEEAQKIAPPPAAAEPKEPSVTINYADVQPDGQVQIMEKIGVHLDPIVAVAEHKAEVDRQNAEMDLKKQAQEHGQSIADRSAAVAEKPPKPAPKK